MKAGPRLVLASGSPRRRELLAHLRLPFEVHSADIDESQKAFEAPNAYVARLSLEKATLVHARFPDAWVLASDTSVVIDNEVVGKPTDDVENLVMLKHLSGRTHRVLTGVTLLGPKHWTDVVETLVHFRAIDTEEATAYVATGEGHDKAGGYAFQGGASAFITRIEGSPSNVIGLPLSETALLLARAGLKGSPPRVDPG